MNRSGDAPLFAFGENGSVLRVSEISDIIGGLLSDPRLNGCYVRGEITNWKPSATGHRYFSLSEKDGDHTVMLNCVIWRSDAVRLAFSPEDGMDVIAFGSIGHYAPQGRYQFYIRDLHHAGAGDKYLLVEHWRRELAAEGIFAPERKRQLPSHPVRIGVVTSGTGAVLQDIRNVIGRRYPVEIIVSPTAVQGEGAHTGIAEAISRIDGLVDVIIVARGGGSFEDLFPFNHPDVVRAVAACRTPVVSAIGHEVDVTLCDLAADIRAPTPSAAAELAVPDRAILKEALSTHSRQLRTVLLARAGRAEEILSDLRGRIHPRRMEQMIRELREEAQAVSERLVRSFSNRCERERLKLGQISATLGAHNPLALLSRGYIVAEQDGRAVRSAESLAPGAGLRLRFADGRARVRVEEVTHGTEL